MLLYAPTLAVLLCAPPLLVPPRWLSSSFLRVSPRCFLVCWVCFVFFMREGGWFPGVLQGGRLDLFAA